MTFEHGVKPKLITFEGGEGSGKSTQSKMLYEELNTTNIKAIHTREIGGTYLAEKIRDVLMEHDFSEAAEMFLIMAARYEHLNKVIIPALAKGQWVICDRYVDSTAAYQTVNSGLTYEDIYEMHKKIKISPHFLASKRNMEHENIYKQFADVRYQDHGIMPDVTFFLDVNPETGLKRAKQRGKINKFEEKTMEYHWKVYHSFHKIAAMRQNALNANIFQIIDCNDKSASQIHSQISHNLRVIIGKEMNKR